MWLEYIQKIVIGESKSESRFMPQVKHGIFYASLTFDIGVSVHQLWTYINGRLLKTDIETPYLIRLYNMAFLSILGVVTLTLKIKFASIVSLLLLLYYFIHIHIIMHNICHTSKYWYGG